MNHISCHVSKLNHFRISHVHIYIYVCACVCDFHIWKEQHMTHIVYHISFLKIHAYNTCIYIYICICVCVTFVYLFIYMPHVHVNSGYALIRRFCQNTKTHTHYNIYIYNIPYGSKYFLRRYLTPQIIPQTLPKKVLGSIGIYIYMYYCKLYIKKHHLTGAKRREWMGCWGLLGSLFIVIMDHSRKFAAKNQ